MTAFAGIPEGFGLETEVVNATARDRAVQRCRQVGISLPTFAQLADPPPPGQALAGVDPDAADAANLWRVNWFNDGTRAGRAAVPEHVVIPPELSGVASPIVMLLGNRFPMIGAHKVLAAYSCLAPRLVTGQFDPETNRAVWPSTGNYARGGIAISKIMGCRGVAVLPEGMSAERFEWLDRWTSDPADVIRTPGSESNVKEIYDACAALAADPDNVILNQFCEYGNHLGHVTATATAVERVMEHYTGGHPGARLAGFVAASGSAGTLGAGDPLKERHGSVTAVVEALECPTLLYNGYGEHNIQGIGDKHVPLIHNVTNTDVVVAVSDRATDELGVLFGSPEGRDLLAGRGVGDDVIAHLDDLGLSSICNLLAAAKTARVMDYGPDDVMVTVATDGAALYGSERAKTIATTFGGDFGDAEAAAVADRWLGPVDTDHVLRLSDRDRDRVFNLGYFTWVEQQGVDLGHFDARRDQSFWRALRDLVPVWDELIDDFNARVARS
ncbi:pyridoxal-phosphate dependent enzyme [Candidatus Poriferisocius sp.]|uniref:pyridoxal-phosphate dependent enzyme n=1 Tax=Candidatus Poriferisocius sp. TaxID=3101276 RepID=UPI003B5B965C